MDDPAQQELPEQQDDRSVFHRLGGAPVLRAVVSGLYQRAVADESLGPFFAGTSMPALRAHHLRFLTSLYADNAALDDSGDVTASLIMEKHRRLFEEKGLSEKSFDRFAAHLVDALRSQQVADALIDEAMGSILPMRAVFERGAKRHAKAKKGTPRSEGRDARSRSSSSKGPSSVASSRSANGSHLSLDGPMTSRQQRLAAFLGEDEEGQELQCVKAPPPRKIKIRSSSPIGDAKAKTRAATKVSQDDETKASIRSGKGSSKNTKGDDARSRASSTWGTGSTSAASQCSKGSLTSRQLRLAAFLGEGDDEPEIGKRAPPRKIEIKRAA
jgi:hemoglobin